MITYINVAQGRNIIPRIGQMIELNADIAVSPTQRTGETSHQIMAAIRGPNRTRAVKKQHIANLLQDFIMPWVRKIHGGST
jgi:hypothetical protein